MATASRTEPGSGIKYYCLNPVSEACKRGFRSLTSYRQHQNVKHAPIHKLLHTTKYPFIPEVPHPSQASSTSTSHEIPSQGPYFTKHPLLNGMFALLPNTMNYYKYPAKQHLTFSRYSM